jgi:predicted nuclease of restriction endonuclease-like (RecB) superfamily
MNKDGYFAVVNDIKVQIAASQQRTLWGANRELITLYWNIGNVINANKTWGSKFIENLALDIKLTFPKLHGFSFRNLKYMAQFARIYSDLEIGREPPAQLTWTHNTILMDRIKDRQEMLWYAKQTIENGWSSNILDLQIDGDLYTRQVLADKTTNFKDRLPPLQSDLAQQVLKDPYVFDFIENHQGMVERDVESELVKHISNFLLELGSGFSYVGQQYHLEIGGKDFYIDLLFYNLKLRSYVVVELKMKEFEPEYAGKLNFYVSAVDNMLKQSCDNPTIGILLCKKKNKIIAEYALQNITSPISVNEFKLFDKLPKEYEEILPTAQDIESRIKRI